MASSDHSASLTKWEKDPYTSVPHRAAIGQEPKTEAVPGGGSSIRQTEDWHGGRINLLHSLCNNKIISSYLACSAFLYNIPACDHGPALVVSGAATSQGLPRESASPWHSSHHSQGDSPESWICPEHPVDQFAVKSWPGASLTELIQQSHGL